MNLRERLTARIAARGPISVADYMDACLHDPDDGYYAIRPGLGAAGDFITAPHVSQIFGELLGLWAAEVWNRLGRPARLRLVELGPGDGTMMSDMLRAARAAPGFLEAAEVWLVETSAPLRAAQAAALPPVRWADSLAQLPTDAPVIILANEFLDCLPIRQWIRADDGWTERLVGLGADGALAFVTSLPPLHGDLPLSHISRGGPKTPLPEGEGGVLGATPRSVNPADEGEGEGLYETSKALTLTGQAIGALMARATGAALFVDYGRDAPSPGDTLQALRGHAKESPLAHPGLADLTAHVDFPAFLAAAADAGAQISPIRAQGDLLRDLGAEVRAAALTRARPDQAAVIARQFDRLISPAQMGVLFKAACVHSSGLAPPGFEAFA